MSMQEVVTFEDPADAGDPEMPTFTEPPAAPTREPIFQSPFEEPARPSVFAESGLGIAAPERRERPVEQTDAGALRAELDLAVRPDTDVPAAPPVPQPDIPVPAMVADELVKRYRTFTLIDPNRLWVMIVAIALLGGILAASLGASFTSVYAMAAWIGLPQAVQWLPVVILDVAIIGYSWALLVFSSRARDGRPTVFDGIHGLPGQPNLPLTAKEARSLRERTWSTRIALGAVTLMSVAANFMHTFDFWHGNISTPQSILGAIYSASIPLMALFATEELIRLVFVRRKQVYGGEVA